MLVVSGVAAPDERIGQHRNVIEAASTAGVGKIVYTSVQGPDEGSSFSPILQSNRQTGQDVRESGLDWVIGRNGIYTGIRVGAFDNPSDYAEAAGRPHQSCSDYFSRKNEEISQ